MLLSGLSIAQQKEKDLHQDLKEVRIVASRKNFYSEDVRITRIDTLLRKQNSTLNLGQLLTMTTPVMVKSYGSTGSLSSISLRGSGSNHTSVNWNGFPLNSLTLGSQDLSAVDGGLMQDVSLSYGASGSLHGSGTFGGSVELNNSTDWKRKKEVSLNAELGSFGHRRFGTQVALGDEKMQYLLNAFSLQADNDFPYTDEILVNPNQHRKHNEVENRAIVQNFFLKLPHAQQLEVGAWYQFKDKNLPLIMGANKAPKENQKDESFRTYLKYSKRFNQSSLVVKTAWFDDFQKYVSEELVSEFKTKRLYGDVNYRYYLSNSIVFDVGGVYQYSNADVTAYGRTIEEHSASVVAALKYSRKHWVLNASARKEYNSNENPKPLYSLGVRYDIFPGKLSFRSNLSTKFRIPTFNEKYWQPGGNPDLIPEEGWSAEAGFQGGFLKKEKQELNWNLTAYHSRIKNFIQWVYSSEIGDYTPVATDEVLARGVEMDLSFRKELGNWKWIARADYTYTKSTNQNGVSTNDRQLIYVPEQQGKLFLSLFYAKTWISFQHSYKGEMYYSKNDDRKLDAYWVSDIYVGQGVKLFGFDSELQFRVQNLWDKEYQVVKSYPMPGRAYYVSYNIKFK
jgi:outer membrane cobalamin receptor